MYKMTLIEKIVYLLNNEYITSNHKELGRVFISKDGNKRFTNRDLIFSWDSLRVF